MALAGGMIARTACLAFATENTHGFEIAHLDGITALRRRPRALAERVTPAPAWSNIGPRGGVAQLVRAAES